MNKVLQTGGFLVVLASCLSTTTPLHAQTVEESLRRADTQYNLYAYNTALNSYSEVLKIDPNNAWAMARKGDCYFQLNRPADALPWYDYAATTGKVDANVYFRYAQALMQTGDYIGAKKWFNYYADSNPSVGKHYASVCDWALQSRTTAYMVKNEPINTATADYSPAFYGNRIVFNSARVDITRKNKKNDAGSGSNEIFVTQRNPENNMLQRPGFLLTDIQKSPSFNEGPLAYSSNGSRVAFCHNQFVDGTRQIADKGLEMSIYISEVNADGKWATTRPFPFNSSDYAVGFPWLSADGNSLYFASNMPGGMGGWDIYVSTWQAVTGMWTSPRNLGATINTEGNEITPFFDGQDFYFASDWHNGYGGMDIFKAASQNGYFTDISNMGPGINSARDDYGYIFDSNANIGYFTSNRSEGKGNEDIWQVSRALDEFSITVRDQNQNLLADAEIDFSNCGAGVYRTDANGRYAFAVPAGKANCNATVRKAGYPTGLAVINSNGDKNIVVTLGAVSTTPATYSTTPSTSPSLSNEVLGSVVDVFTHDPVYGVKVSAQPLPGGTPLVTYTNASGTYTFNMEPYRQYYVTFTKDGYADAAVSFTAGLSGAQNTITQVQLNAISSQIASPTTTSTGAPAPVTHSTGIPDLGLGTQPTTGGSTVILAPKTYSEQPKAKASTGISGWAIQLGAHPANELPLTKIEQLDGLREHGNLYTKPENNMNKIRLGLYGSKKQAEDVLKKVRKSQKDAFVVEESDADPALALDATGKPMEYGLLAQKSGDMEKPAAIKPINPDIRFAVQVGSFNIANPLIINSFNNLADVGHVYTRPENEMVRVRVGVWDSQYDAEAAHALIMSRGYKDAMVVVEKSGTNLPVIQPGQFAPTPPAVQETPVSTQPIPLSTPSPAGTGTSQLRGGGVSTGKVLTPVTAPASAGDLPSLDGPVVYSTPKSGKMLEIGAAPSTGMPPADENTRYMVRISSLTSMSPGKFDTKRAESAGGKVEARISPSGATVMLLTGFASEADALVANEKLHKMGFTDAYVVLELNKDGILRRISD